MSKQTINIGASPNDGTGTPLRTSFDYTNQNFTELYTALGGGVGLPGATTQVIFNDGGTNLAGDAGLVYNKTTDALTVAGLVTAGSAAITGAATVGTTLGVTGVSTLASAVVTGALTSGTTTLVAHAAGYTGKVGIGTATPAEKLDIYSAAGTAAIKLQTAANIPFTLNSQIPGVSNDGFSIYDGTASANRLTIDSSGNVNVVGGNLVIGTSGKGIDFAATAGTGTSELLNDYEEGTFTPTVTSEFGTIGTTTVASANYTKIGRVVTINFDIAIITAGTGTGSLVVTLPFNSGTEACGAGREISLTGNMCQVFRQSATTVAVRFYDNLTPITNLNRVVCSYTYSV
jgi:hypothetical protein